MKAARWHWRGAGRTRSIPPARIWPGVQVLGPVPALISRVKRFWRVHTLLKAPRTLPASALANAVRAADARTKIPSGHRVNIDVDPVGLY